MTELYGLFFFPIPHILIFCGNSALSRSANVNANCGLPSTHTVKYHLNYHYML